VASLMKLIFNQSYFDATMSDLNYDANKLPLGKLSKGTIARGFQALQDLSLVLDNTDAASRAEVERLSDRRFPRSSPSHVLLAHFAGVWELKLAMKVL
jgi:poly [ADP-ribose] polymerase